MTEQTPPQQPPAAPPPPTQPQAAPPAGAPPQSAWTQHQPQAAAWPQERGTPGSVIAVGILLLILGLVLGLVGGLIAFAAGFFDQLDTLGAPIVDPQTGEAIDPQVALEMVQGLVAGFGWVLLVVALAHLIAGIWIIRRAGWARVLGIILAIVGVLLWGLAFVASLATLGQPGAEDVIGGVVVTGIVAVIYLWSFIVLLRRGDAFRRA